MSAHVTLQARVAQYLAERRHAGFDLTTMGHGLERFVRYVDQIGHDGPLTVNLMAAWAVQAKGGRGDRATFARQFRLLRPFAGWLRQFEPNTEVPDEAIFGPVPGRTAPHIYREHEIVELLTAARGLGQSPGLIAIGGHRNAIWPYSLHRTAYLRGAGALRCRRELAGPGSDDSPEQVWQVTIGATASQRCSRSGEISNAAQFVCACQTPGAVLRQHARETAWAARWRSANPPYL